MSRRDGTFDILGVRITVEVWEDWGLAGRLLGQRLTATAGLAENEGGTGAFCSSRMAGVSDAHARAIGTTPAGHPRALTTRAPEAPVSTPSMSTPSPSVQTIGRPLVHMAKEPEGRD